MPKSTIYECRHCKKVHPSVHGALTCSHEHKKLYSTLDICRAFSIPRERLRDWIVRGYIKPMKVKGSGRQGVKSVFSIEGAYRVFLFDKLIRCGFTRAAASHCARNMDLNKEEPEAILVSPGEGAFAKILVPSAWIKLRVDEAISKLV